MADTLDLVDADDPPLVASTAPSQPLPQSESAVIKAKEETEPRGRPANHTNDDQMPLENSDCVREKRCSGGGNLVSVNTGDEQQVETEHRPSRKTTTWILLCGIGLSVLLVALDNTILSTAIPKIVADFQALESVSWYGSAYLLTNCSCQLVFGALYAAFSLKRILLAAILIFEVGSAICGSAPTSVALIVGRAVAGIGAAGIFQGAFMVVAVSVAAPKRPLYNGIFGAVYGIASIMAPLVGGAFTQHISWRWCFYLNLPLGAVTVATIVWLLQTPAPITPGRRTWKQQVTEAVQNMDPLGLLVFLPSIVCLLLALVWGGTKYAWSDGRIIALFVVFGVLLLAFVGVEIRANDHALLRGQLVRQRNVVCGGWFAFLLGATNFMVAYYLPLWFQDVKGVSPTQSGVMSLPTMLSMVTLSFISGSLISRWGEYIPFFYLSSLLTSVGVGLLSTFAIDTAHPRWIGYQVIFGAGLGLGVQLPITVVQLSCPPADMAVATALMVFSQILGGTVFVAVAQTIITNQLQTGLQRAMPDLAATLMLNLTATQTVNNVAPDRLPEIRHIFNGALTSAWRIAAGIAAATVIAALGIQRVKFTKPNAVDATSELNGHSEDRV